MQEETGMIIIHNYHIIDTNGIEKCVSCESELRCPVCGERLFCRDWKMRRYRDVDGIKHVLWIRRMKCGICDRLHNELPDFIIPYKQHVSLTIEKAVEENLLGKELLSVYIPDVKTVKRWRIWIEENILKLNSNIEKICKKNQYIQKYSIIVPITLKELVINAKGWLSAILDLTLINHCTCFSLP